MRYLRLTNSSSPGSVVSYGALQLTRHLALESTVILTMSEAAIETTSSAERKTVAATAAAAAALAAVVYTVDPYSSGSYPTCPSLALLGVHCPGCGSTRCLHSLLHGDFATAWSMNPLTIFGLAYVVWRFSRWAAKVWFGIPYNPKPRPKLLWMVLAVIVVFWVLRNTSWGAFLAPG